MIPKIKVELRLIGTETSPDEITNFIGMPPTRVFRTGDSVQGTALAWKSNGWCLSLGGYKDTYDLGEEISALLDYIAKFSARIRQVCDERGLRSEVSCAVYLSDEAPAITWRHEMIALIDELKATLDIDIIQTA